MKTSIFMGFNNGFLISGVHVVVRLKEQKPKNVSRRLNMTQNQIAYWQNVERERSNRANEQIEANKQRSTQSLQESQKAKAEADTLKSKHDIVQGYLKNTPGSDLSKTTAAALAAESLGITDEFKNAKASIVDKGKSAIAETAEKISDAVSNVPNTPAGVVVDAVLNAVTNGLPNKVREAVQGIAQTISNKTKSKSGKGGRH